MTLSDLAARPELVDQVSRADAYALMFKALGVAALLATRAGSSESSIPDDQALSTREACALLGLSRATLDRHADEEPYAGLRVWNPTAKGTWSRYRIMEFLRTGSSRGIATRGERKRRTLEPARLSPIPRDNVQTGRTTWGIR